ncbi:hypothetical protein GCM10010967_00840 [Dyadobacter beijingensis]|uniref:DUF3299 domain-containing protein n=1 Tax=Dyadobacter beijingensis TaxID=365489 RepID=A0ABQ2HC15_9BACT|nr:hypothetical protein [Dyadobacter beijingensis]GGM73140.1 hypothetical protein GCM10010967_00840 [Dyadobacter beijingensis]
MRRLAIFLVPLFAFTTASDTLEINWKRLADVKFSRKLNKELSMYFLYPTFGPSVNVLQGKEVRIRGYMIPVDEADNIYVISAKPMAACFFCGGAGPESIIELQFRKKKQRFRTDEVLTVRGKLALNANDVDHLNYILKDAEVIE